MSFCAEQMNAMEKISEGSKTRSTPGIIHAEVTKNNDTEKKGYIEARFKRWEDGKDVVSWVRLMAPYGGPEYGHYVVPEVGDEIVIGFIDDSIKEPVFLGTLYKVGNAMVNESFDENNYKKHIKTKGKIDLMLIDEDAKQSVTLTTPKESIIQVEDENETCTISNKAGDNMTKYDYKGKKIETKAPENIKFQCGGVIIEMDGKAGDLKITVPNNLTIKATTKTSIDGGTNLEVKGVTSKYTGSSIKISAPTVSIGSNVSIG
jgi:uncharacterized protein involved in type VI secretion and phage assembly